LVKCKVQKKKVLVKIVGTARINERINREQLRPNTNNPFAGGRDKNQRETFMLAGPRDTRKEKKRKERKGRRSERHLHLATIGGWATNSNRTARRPQPDHLQTLTGP
jgi:hypothetical protein